ncbi:MAG: nucleotide exchange factor GrpE [Terriglobales bacterium]
MSDPQANPNETMIGPEHELAASEPPAELEAEVARLTAERDGLQDKLLRALAEADNARKRFARDLQDAHARAVMDAVRPFLPVLDSFELAAAHAGASASGEMRSGLEALHRQLLDAVRKAGLEAVDAPAGQPFDPHLHEALEMVDTDTVADGHVVEQLQRGYKLRDRLVRPAMVRVARRAS